MKIEAQTRLGIKMPCCRENVSLWRCGTIRGYLQTEKKQAQKLNLTHFNALILHLKIKRDTIVDYFYLGHVIVFHACLILKEMCFSSCIIINAGDL